MINHDRDGSIAELAPQRAAFAPAHNMSRLKDASYQLELQGQKELLRAFRCSSCLFSSVCGVLLPSSLPSLLSLPLSPPLLFTLLFPPFSLGSSTHLALCLDFNAVLGLHLIKRERDVILCTDMILPVK